MGREIEKLSHRKIMAIKEPGYYPDGGSLYLQVSKSGSKSWIFRYTRSKKATDMGLGSFMDVSLKEARDRASELRKDIKSGINPMLEKIRLGHEAKLKQAKSITFAECATAYIDAKKIGWSSAKHAQQWPTTLEQYVFPVFGDLPVADVDTSLVIQALKPIWNTKNETASRVRSRIELVLGWATVSEYRTGENPARWRGHLANLLPKPSAVQKVAHHPALPYSEIYGFMLKLRNYDCISAKCLEFLILTAARRGEAIGATWQEINLIERAWDIPAERMKAKRPHTVPLSNQAMDILMRLSEYKTSDFLFPGLNGAGLSSQTIISLLKRMERTDITTHGFRSSFRDWAAETTAFSNEVLEMALAHTITNKAEAAYRRGDLFNKRAVLMQAWSDYIDTKPAAGDVIQFGTDRKISSN